MLASCSRCPAPSVSCAAARRTRSVAASAECAWRSERAAAEDQHKSRRHLLLAAGSAAALLLPRPAQAEEAAAAAAAAPAIEILSDEPGTVGTASARQGDLVLVHYVGTVVGKVFDSTRGGQMYRDGGRGALRPVIIRLGGGPVPGICAGLQDGLKGMRVGGRRTFTVPASLGFGGETVLGPYGAVPGGSTLRYEVELLRLSRQGPEALMSGVTQCGGGFVNERTSGCADITPAEFV